MTRNDVNGNSGEIAQVASLRVLENATIVGAVGVTGTSTFSNIVTGVLRSTSEYKTISAAGVSISSIIPITYITTDGTAALNNAILAAPAFSNVIKIICLAVLGNAGDTWKITPSTLAGGTIITFAGTVGLGCILVYDYTNSQWVVVANNGGVIS